MAKDQRIISKNRIIKIYTYSKLKKLFSLSAFFNLSIGLCVFTALQSESSNRSFCNHVQSVYYSTNNGNNTGSENRYCSFCSYMNNEDNNSVDATDAIGTDAISLLQLPRSMRNILGIQQINGESEYYDYSTDPSDTPVNSITQILRGTAENNNIDVNRNSFLSQILLHGIAAITFHTDNGSVVIRQSSSHVSDVEQSENIEIVD